MRKLCYTRPLSRLVVSAGLAAIAALGGAQAPRFSVTNLGQLASGAESDFAYAMSSDGTKVVGSAQYLVNRQSVYHAFYWNGTMHDIGALGGPTAYGVSRNGTVVLGAYPGAVWSLTSGKVALMAPDGSSANAYAINDSDIVVGRGRTTTWIGNDSGGNPVYAFVALQWSRDPITGNWGSISLQPLPGFNFSGAFGGIDANGNIVGTSSYYDPSTGVTIANEATLWSPNDGFVPHDMGPIGSVGAGSWVDPVTLDSRYVWNLGSGACYTDSTGTIQLPFPDPSNPANQAHGVNASGMVAGFATYGGNPHAYCWSGGVQTDLGVLTGMTSSLTWTDTFRARPIDDNGFIIGWCNGSNGSQKAFVSTPTSRGTSAKMLDLNTLLSNTLKGVSLSSLNMALATNNAGFILCNGTASGSGGQRVALLRRVQ